jgi:hypothetical protein
MIREFPSDHFYNGSIADGIDAGDRLGPPLACFPDQRIPLLFWNVHAIEQSVGKWPWTAAV